MSRAQVQAVHDVFEAWNRGDLELVLEYLSPDWEWRTAGKFPGLEAVYRGKEGFTRFWEAFRESWESIRIDIERVEDLGDQALVLMTFHGKGRGSGVDVTTEYANLIAFRGVLATHQVGYGDWKSALEAVGLPD
jgi:ketosteroid isomerase-like protein